MLGLPKSTEMNRALPKKAIFDKFKPTAAERQRFDSQISRLAIVDEISPTTVNIAAGETIELFYVVLVSLKSADCDKKNIQLISKLIGQNMLFVLEYEGAARLATFRSKVIQSETKPLTDWKLELTGLNLDAVWEDLIAQIGGIVVAEGNTLDGQIADDTEREKLLRRIEQLERQARSEKQPRKKFELAQEMKKLKNKLGVCYENII